MTAKNKDDFLFQLHTELHRIGIEDNEDIFADFEEHFRASSEQGLTEEQTCEKLGDVKEIARSYVDIESTRINSILANAIEDSRPHASLVKPGRSVPAASVQINDDTAADVEEAPTTEIITDEVTPIREYTPEHIAMEPAPSSAPASAPRVNIEKSVPPVQPTQSEQPSESVREFTPEHISQEAAPADEKSTAASSDNNDAAKDPHKADIPPQCGYNNAGTGNGFRWSDIKGKEANVDVGRLIMWICLDLFVFSWALPMLATLIIAFGGFSINIVVNAVSVFGTASIYHFLSQIFLCSGLGSLGILLIMLTVKMGIGFIKIIRNIIIAHVKAIFGI